MTEIKIAHTPIDFSTGKKLIVEYADSLGMDLSFQNFAFELARLHVQYNEPEGALVLLYIDQIPAGCVGIQKSENRIAELKRMYIRPDYRGQGAGKKCWPMHWRLPGNWGMIRYG